MQDITVKRKTDEIHIVAHHNSEDKVPAYRRLMWLRRVLPSIVVKVRRTLKVQLGKKTDEPGTFRQGVIGLQRAVIQQNPKGFKELLVEGEGLREVMTTDGEVLFVSSESALLRH